MASVTVRRSPLCTMVTPATDQPLTAARTKRFAMVLRQIPVVDKDDAVGAIKAGRSPALMAIVGVVAVAIAARVDGTYAGALHVGHRLAPTYTRRLAAHRG